MDDSGRAGPWGRGQVPGAEGRSLGRRAGPWGGGQVPGAKGRSLGRRAGPWGGGQVPGAAGRCLGRKKVADLGLLGKFVKTRLHGHLWRRSLQQNVPLWLHFKCILIRWWCDLRQGVFEARIVGLLFWAFSLGPPLAKSQKMADLGLLGKFVITRLHGHLWRRSLQQNGPLWLHFKCILIRR